MSWILVQNDSAVEYVNVDKLAKVEFGKDETGSYADLYFAVPSERYLVYAGRVIEKKEIEKLTNILITS